MGFNKNNYRRIREKYETKYLRAEAEADRRTEEVHNLSPALAEVDRELSRTAGEIALAAIGTGGDYAEKLAEVKAKNLALQQRRAELLAQLGYPADYTKPPYECPRCRDTGFVDTKMCDCMRRELIMASYETSGFGALLKTQSFETFDFSYYQNDPKTAAVMAQNVEMLKNYAETFTPDAKGLLFLGGTGLGKTHLSTAVARRILDRGFDVYYTGATKMFSDFERARFGDRDENISRPDLTRYTDCELLIIDDLGAEVTNQFTVSCLYDVLNERINLGRPFIVSTNLPVLPDSNGKKSDNLQTRYGDRIVSRLLSECKTVRFAGTDVRIQRISRG